MNVTKNSRRKKEGAPGEDFPQKRASVRKSETGNSKTQSFWRGAISIFILFHLIAITCWAVPTNFPPIRGVKEFVRPYMLWTGLFQSWDFFAPNPRPVNTYIKAVVITHNSHVHVWAFPRMEQLSFGERYRKERYRKFAEVLLGPQSAALSPDAANHIARFFNNQADPPDKVMLIQFQTDIKLGAANAYDSTPRPSIIYEDYVQAEDLK
jgi:hypothetical protein